MLMRRIYLPVYKHLWSDGGRWYLNTFYTKEHLEKELKEPHSRYYFVDFKNKIIGILRILLKKPLLNLASPNPVKLHRIYLDPMVHGKGLGKLLMSWVENHYCRPGPALLWLEVMDSQEPAIRFYENLGFQNAHAFRLPYKAMYKQLRGMYSMVKEIKNV
jgi:GNAT superfamily N-acetyltransferase